MSLQTEPPEKIYHFLEQAEDAAEAAKELSFRLLTFSKGGEPVKRISSVEHVLRRAVSLSLSGSNATSDLAFSRNLSPVEIDEGQMTQVFSNILINAKEAMPDGGTISIRAENVSISEGTSIPLKEGDYVRISIQDSGTGIPEEIQFKIFDPYFSTKGLGPRKGSGLGLSICLSIVKKHGGHISVESRVGKGTTFHIYIPASKEVLHAQETGIMQQQGAPQMRLLFMDDDEKVRSIVGNMIEYLGHQVAYAKNGEEAIELYQRAKESGKTFDAVILDLTVQGGMGGDKAIKKLLETDPAVKAVISSGYADAPLIKDYRAYGFVGAIAKPYKIEQLKELLAKLRPDH
jgi:two-component system, cell cycle sensor histidine kinase and response regulator CckA